MAKVEVRTVTPKPVKTVTLELDTNEAQAVIHYLIHGGLPGDRDLKCDPTSLHASIWRVFDALSSKRNQLDY